MRGEEGRGGVEGERRERRGEKHVFCGPRNCNVGPPKGAVAAAKTELLQRARVELTLTLLSGDTARVQLWGGVTPARIAPPSRLTRLQAVLSFGTYDRELYERLGKTDGEPVYDPGPIDLRAVAAAQHPEVLGRCGLNSDCGSGGN